MVLYIFSEPYKDKTQTLIKFIQNFLIVTSGPPNLH